MLSLPCPGARSWLAGFHKTCRDPIPPALQSHLTLQPNFPCRTICPLFTLFHSSTKLKKSAPPSSHLHCLFAVLHLSSHVFPITTTCYLIPKPFKRDSHHVKTANAIHTPTVAQFGKRFRKQTRLSQPPPYFSPFLLPPFRSVRHFPASISFQYSCTLLRCPVANQSSSVVTDQDIS